MKSQADVVIVGGGLLGLATAFALRGQREAVVLEREAIGHTRGGSHGPSRISRLGYDDPGLVRMAMAARERWTALEAVAGERLLFPTPQLTFGPGVDAVHAALVVAGAPVEEIDADEIARRFPVFAGCDDAILETESAVIAADRTLAALRSHMDAELREGVRVHGVSASQVETDDGVIEARDVVVCAGPWSRALVPTLPTYATLEHAGYLRVGGDVPIFIDFSEPAVYGLPNPEGDLYKIAVHHGGEEIDPEAPFRPMAAAVDALLAAADERFPGCEVFDVDVCPYDNTDDERFIIERVDGIVVGAGTSGHGFKFGPLLGEQLAALVLAETPPRRL